MNSPKPKLSTPVKRRALDLTTTPTKNQPLPPFDSPSEAKCRKIRANDDVYKAQETERLISPIKKTGRGTPNKYNRIKTGIEENSKKKFNSIRKSGEKRKSILGRENSLSSFHENFLKANTTLFQNNSENENKNKQYEQTSSDQITHPENIFHVSKSSNRRTPLNQIFLSSNNLNISEPPKNSTSTTSKIERLTRHESLLLRNFNLGSNQNVSNESQENLQSFKKDIGQDSSNNETKGLGTHITDEQNLFQGEKKLNRKKSNFKKLVTILKAESSSTSSPISYTEQSTVVLGAGEGQILETDSNSTPRSRSLKQKDQSNSNGSLISSTTPPSSLTFEQIVWTAMESEEKCSNENEWKMFLYVYEYFQISPESLWNTLISRYMAYIEETSDDPFSFSRFLEGIVQIFESNTQSFIFPTLELISNLQLNDYEIESRFLHQSYEKKIFQKIHTSHRYPWIPPPQLMHDVDPGQELQSPRVLTSQQGPNTKIINSPTGKVFKSPFDVRSIISPRSTSLSTTFSSSNSTSSVVSSSTTSSSSCSSTNIGGSCCLNFNQMIHELKLEGFAVQFTLNDIENFGSITIQEWLTLRWGKSDGSETCPGIVNSISRFNKLSHWICGEILSSTDQKTRKKNLKCFLNIANKCKQFHNYNGLMIILSALNMHPISRLKDMWASLSSRYRILFAELDNLMESSHNYKSYREQINLLYSSKHSFINNSLFVPFIGLYLRDITFINEMPSFEDSQNQLLNISKVNQLGSVLNQIYSTQQILSLFLQSQSFYNQLGELKTLRSTQSTHQLNDISLIKRVPVASSFSLSQSEKDSVNEREQTMMKSKPSLRLSLGYNNNLPINGGSWLSLNWKRNEKFVDFLENVHEYSEDELYQFSYSIQPPPSSTSSTPLS